MVGVSPESANPVRTQHIARVSSSESDGAPSSPTRGGNYDSTSYYYYYLYLLLLLLLLFILIVFDNTLLLGTSTGSGGGHFMTQLTVSTSFPLLYFYSFLYILYM